MAIQINLNESQYGINFDDAYYRICVIGIERIDDEKNRHRVMMDVVAYATKPMSENVKQIDAKRFFAPLAEIESINADDFLSKCYTWIMAHPDFYNAKSV